MNFSPAETLTELQRQLDRLEQDLIADSRESGERAYLVETPELTRCESAFSTERSKPFQLSAALYRQTDHLDATAGGGSDARETLQLPGLLGASQWTLETAAEVNRLKARFEQEIKDWKAALPEMPALEKDRLVREKLSVHGFPRAHLRQIYRQIVLCPPDVDAIALSWVKARKSIRKVTVDWCEKKLEKMDPQMQDPGIQYQRRLLGGLDPSRANHLRQIQVRSRPTVQVAVVENDAYRQIGYSSMPVLVQLDPGKSLPDFTRIAGEPSATVRRVRKDRTIEPEPFLAALRVHLLKAPAD